MNNNITNEEINAIMFYLGDKKIVEQLIYRGGPKAYNTINALLNLGTRNEEDRAKENKIVEIYDAEHLKSYIFLIINIFKASLKYRNSMEYDKSKSTSYRIDRLSSFKTFITNKDHRIEGFFSTCRNGLLPQYANSKQDIVLLEVVRDPSVPYLDFQDLLDNYYSKPEEAEILIPFGTKIANYYEVALSEEEIELYKDKNGAAPKHKYVVELTQGEYEEIFSELEEYYYNYLTNEDRLSHIINSMRLIFGGKELSACERDIYLEWKEIFNSFINSKIAKLIKEYSKSNDVQTAIKHV